MSGLHSDQIKYTKKGGAYSMYVRNDKFGRPEGEKLLGRPKNSFKDNIKIFFI